jgi:hypothetical protein
MTAPDRLTTARTEKQRATTTSGSKSLRVAASSAGFTNNFEFVAKGRAARPDSDPPHQIPMFIWTSNFCRRLTSYFDPCFRKPLYR